jgi:outer membrane immunogenic protein
MKKFLLGTAALVALGVPAIAADMPVRRAPPAPVFSWTGCYVGVNVGYSWGESRHSAETGSILLGTLGTAGPLAPAAQGADITPKFRMGGLLAGGTGGCQYQWGVWVLGIEADGGMANKEGQANNIAPIFDPRFVNQTSERTTTTVRARLGYAVDKWLFYVTGGAAWATVDATSWFGCATVITPAGGCPGVAAVAGLFPAVTAAGIPTIRQKQTMFGYSVGVGTEYSIGYGWSIKSEYIFLGFRSKDFFNGPDMISCCFAPGVGTFVSPTRVSLYDHTFKWGLNYKFDFLGGKAPYVYAATK